VTESKNSRIRRRVGDVVSILLDGKHEIAYAAILEQSKFAVFDGRDVSNAEGALQRPPLFYVSVMNSAVTSGRWPIVAFLPERIAHLQAPPTFMQDPLRPEKFQIYDRGTMRPATRAECESLERTAVWDAEHVEDRIRDTYAGKESRIVQSMHIDAL